MCETPVADQSVASFWPEGSLLFLSHSNLNGVLVTFSRSEKSHNNVMNVGFLRSLFHPQLGAFSWLFSFYWAGEQQTAASGC